MARILGRLTSRDDRRGMGCHSQGFGDSAGVELILVPSGDFFRHLRRRDRHSAVPDPSQITVSGMTSGENATHLPVDC